MVTAANWDWSHVNGVKIEWGTIPAAVSSLLTAGSLLLGFYILLRDRRSKEKEQALQVAVWLSHSRDSRWHPSSGKSYDGTYTAHISVNNASSAVIRRVRLHYHLPPVKAVRKAARKDRSLDFAQQIPDDWEGADPIPALVFMSDKSNPQRAADDSIQPNDQLTHSDTTYFDPRWFKWVISFVDANGREWWRDAVSNELHQGKYWHIKPDGRISVALKKRRWKKKRAELLANVQKAQAERDGKKEDSSKLLSADGE